MQINIKDQDNEYIWELYDGSDGKEHFVGRSSSLGEAFEHIIQTLVLNSQDYENEIGRAHV